MYDQSITFETRDEYRRKDLAENILKLVEAEIPFSPLLIDGKWGEGKTEFCFKLKNLFEDKGHKCVYIDAFKSDHTDDPLLVIFAAIAACIETSKQKDLKKAFMPLLGFGLKTCGKAGVSWLLKQDADKLGEEAEQIISETSNAALNAISEKLISDCQNQEANIIALQTALKVATKTEKLIVFIDELDRCRPSFGVELLEKIKHVFDIPSLTFILITNKNQLVAAVKHIYGAIEGDDYINKFINLSIKLNRKTNDGYKEKLNSLNHFQEHVKKYQKLNFLHNQGHPIPSLIRFLIGQKKLSLRQIEKFVLKLLIFIELKKDYFERLGDLERGVLAPAIFIDEFFPDLADSIEIDQFTGEDIKRALNLPDTLSDEIESSVKMFIAQIYFMDHGTDQVPKEFQSLKKRLISNDCWSWNYSSTDIAKGLREFYVSILREVRFNSIDS